MEQVHELSAEILKVPTRYSLQIFWGIIGVLITIIIVLGICLCDTDYSDLTKALYLAK